MRSLTVGCFLRLLQGPAESPLLQRRSRISSHTVLVRSVPPLFEDVQSHRDALSLDHVAAVFQQSE